jgi:hypothetical protein
MLELITFLQTHPAIAKQYEEYLTNLKSEVASALAVPKSLFDQAEDRLHRAGVKPPQVTVLNIPADVDKHVAETLEKKHDFVGLRHVNTVQDFLGLPTPPAKGKALKTPVAFRYILDRAFDLVHDEFFSQVLVGDDSQCWDLKKHVRVFRNDRGVLVKRVQIHHLGKPLGAVQLAFLLTKRRIADENLYNTCGNDRCVNPAHHTEGRVTISAKERKAARAKKAVWESPEMKFERTQDNLETILEYMAKDPEKGVVIEELQRAFVVPSPSPSNTPMTLDELTDAMRLGVARSKFYNRQIGDKRIFLKGYPSATRREAAERQLQGVAGN